MKKRIVTIALLVVLTLGAFTTMAMANKLELRNAPAKDSAILLTAQAGTVQDGTAVIRLRDTRGIAAASVQAETFSKIQNLGHAMVNYTGCQPIDYVLNMIFNNEPT